MFIQKPFHCSLHALQFVGCSTTLRQGTYLKASRPWPSTTIRTGRIFQRRRRKLVSEMIILSLRNVLIDGRSTYFLIIYYFFFLTWRTSFPCIYIYAICNDPRWCHMTKHWHKRNNNIIIRSYLSTAKKLGYNKKMWNGDKEPDACDEYWEDLDEDQRQAATVLGYDKESWDKDGTLDKCCVIL